MFDTLNTAQLKRHRAALNSHVPGDPTFIATVAALLRSMLDEVIARRPPEEDPASLARRQADQQIQQGQQNRHKPMSDYTDDPLDGSKDTVDDPGTGQGGNLANAEPAIGYSET